MWYTSVDEKIFELSSYDEETIKDLLWQICYNFKNINEEHNQKYKSSKEAINYIINKCKENGINISFAGENSAKDTMGVDLGINNPIVLDVIVRRCYAAVYEEERCIEKVIKLLKTEDTGFDNSHKRIFGGLRELGFSAEEADYLKGTCHLYPVALFLERLWDFSKKDKIEDKEQNINVEKEEEEPEIIQFISYGNEVTKVNSKENLLNVIIENKESIEKVIKIFNENSINSIELLDKQIQETEALLDTLLDIKGEIFKLESKGISGEYITAKRMDLNSLCDYINRVLD